MNVLLLFMQPLSNSPPYLFYAWMREIQMYPTPYKPLHRLLCLSITIFFALPCILCSSVVDPQYANCKQPFKCGNASVLGELKYPYWGINRPSYCGIPGYEIKCLHNAPFIMIKKLNLTVVGTNPAAHKITVAAAVFWKNLCPAVVLTNTSFNYSISGLDAINLYLSSNFALVTILYGCPPNLSRQLSWSGQDSCSVNRTKIDVHFVTHTPNASLVLAKCKGVAVLPILQESAQALDANTTTLSEALDKGFDLGFYPFSINSSQCSFCVASGGQCGYDFAQNGFTCYCPDKPYDLECPRSKQGKRNTKAIVIGVGIGSVALLALLLGGALLCVRRRRSVQQKSRGIFAIPDSLKDGGGPQALTPRSNGLTSSQGYTTTPSTYSHSNASYMSSASDIGRSHLGVHLFEYTELEQATNNFDESKELGDGGFGTVYYGVLPDGRQVAVKRLYENSLKRIGQFMNEIKILAEIKHPNLVALYGHTSKRSRDLLLVYEYISNGTVADHLHGKFSETSFLRWPNCLNIAVETAVALAYLHRNDVIHRDVKTTNILLDDSFHVKVADFGLSRLFPTDMTHVSTAPQGTPGYVDPEYYQCYRLTEKSDVYSFGVVLIELISSKHAVDITRHRHDVNLASMAVDRIQNCAMHELVDPRLDFDKDPAVQAMVTMVAELGFQCLQQDREMRPTMDEVLERLKAVQSEGFKSQKQEVIVYADDVGLLTNPTPPLSPELRRSSDTV